MSGVAADTASGECAEICRVFWSPRLPDDVDCLVKLSRQLPRLARTANDETQSDAANRSTWAQASSIVEDLIDRHIDLVNHLFETVPEVIVRAGSWQILRRRQVVDELGERRLRYSKASAEDEAGDAFLAAGESVALGEFVGLAAAEPECLGHLLDGQHVG